MSKIKRYYCGEITELLLDQTIEIYGWVHRLRDHGGLIFIDLRDRVGMVQVVANPKQNHLFEKAKNLSCEDVLKIRGNVASRPSGTENPDMLTGKIELIAEDLQILNRAEALPFPIADQPKANEELRLKYRYLDLRRSEMTHNIMFRAKTAQALRHFLDKQGFIEIETPILTKATPEGARDYLVPSRNHPGKFYALPQSPQIFKQLLMMAGFDRYYQIVRCFRDEDLRADRQPEFTQLDIETSFLTQDEILVTIEEMIRELFLKLLNIVLPNPFPRLTYDEAMNRFGSDKPDLRIPLELTGISDLVKNLEFKVFSEAANADNGRVAALRVPKGAKLSRKEIDDYENFVKIFKAKGLAYLKINDIQAGSAGIQSPLLKFLSQETLVAILDQVKAENEDIIFFVADKEANTANEALGALRLKIGEDFALIKKEWQPLWVIDFPMFMKTDGGWTFMHHPFTSPVEADPVKLAANPGQALAQAYDFVLNGSEIGGGSIRIHDQTMQKTVFNLIGIDDQTAEKQFGHLLNAFKYGCPPHGGIAFGLDRLVMMMTGEKSIREVIAFPKNQSAVCPLTDAPSEVTIEQLKELHIKSLPKN